MSADRQARHRAADHQPLNLAGALEDREDLGVAVRPLDAATDPPQWWLETMATTWRTPTDDLGEALLRLMLGAWADDEIGQVLRSVLLTAAHDETTREKLRRVVENSLMGVSQLGVDEPDRRKRSGLISSQIVGLAMMRFVWKIEPVASMSDDDLVKAVAPNLQRYVDGSLT